MKNLPKPLLVVLALLLSAHAHAAPRWTYCTALSPDGQTNFYTQSFLADFGDGPDGYDPVIYGRVVTKFTDWLNEVDPPKKTFRSSMCVMDKSQGSSQADFQKRWKRDLDLDAKSQAVSYPQ